MDNVLSGIVRITAPGAQQAFSEIAAGTQKAESNLKGLGTTAGKTTGVVRQLVPVVGDLSLTLKDQRAILANLQKQFASLSTQQAKSRIGLELAADIKVANAEIKRLEAGATSSFGKIGTSATKGFSAIRQLAFILPGLGIAGIFNLAFTAIEGVVNELFNLGRGFKDGEVAAALFKQALDDISDSAEKLKSRLDFQDDIAKLKASVAGLKGEDLDILDLGNRTKSAVALITAEQKVSDALKAQRDQIAEVAQGYIQAGLASSKFIEIATIAASGKVVPKTLVSQLSGPREKAVADAYIAIVEKIVESDKRSSESQSLIGKNFLQIQEDQNKKQEELLKKRASDYEKFVSETIAQAKKLDGAFKDVIDITPNFSVLDTRNEEFKKALAFLKKFDAGTFKITLKPELDDKEFKEAINLFGKKFKDVKFDILLPIEFPIDPKVIPKTQAEITRILKEVADFKPEPIFLTGDISLDIAVRVDEAAKQFGAEFGQAFRDEVKKNIAKGLDITSAINAAVTRIGAIKQAIEGIQEAFKGIQVDSLANVGEAIGAAFSGGDLENVFKNFGDIIGSGLQDIGKQMIRIGVVAALAKKALSKLFANPALTIIAGVALVAAGAALKSLLSGGIKGFAKGGRPPVGRPSIVGERGPEIFVPDRPGVIVPNHKVKDFQQLSKPGKLTRISTQKEFHDREVNKAVSELSKELVRVVSDSISTIRETNNIRVKESTNLLSKLIDRNQVFKEKKSDKSEKSSYKLATVISYEKEKSYGIKSVVSNEIQKVFRNVLRTTSETIPGKEDKKADKPGKESISKELSKVISAKTKSEKVSSDLSSNDSSTEKETTNFSTALSSVLKEVDHDHSKEVSNELASVVSKIVDLDLRQKDSTDSKTESKDKKTSSQVIFDRSSKDLNKVNSKEKSSKEFSNVLKSVANNSVKYILLSNQVKDSTRETNKETSKEAKVYKEKTYSRSASKELSKIFKETSKLSKSDKSSVSSKTATFVSTNTLLKTLASFHSSATASVKELSKIIQSLKTDKVYKMHTREISNLVRSSTNHTNTISDVLKHFTNQIGFRAAGGPVNHNRPFIVGERGPELFIPKRSGKIIPNHKVTKNIFNQVKNSNKSVSGGIRNVFNNKSTTKNGNSSNTRNRYDKRLFNYSTTNSISSLSNISNTKFGGFRAGGGSVVAGNSFIVGERGLEIFVPNTGQSIVNNNQSTIGGSVSGGTLKVEGNIRIAGNDLIAVMTNAQRSQSRLS